MPRPDRPAAGIEPRVGEVNLRPALGVLATGFAIVAIVSFVSLAWPQALASTLLGTLMIAGAEVDARTFLLPDTVTLGALIGGILAAAVLDPFDPADSAGEASARALGTAAMLLLVRWSYARLRGREGLGLGDIKLAAAIGAWLPLDAIPICFALASSAALILVLFARVRGRPLEAATKLPFGAFLCPALWLVFYATVFPFP
jgi:leader peptidase (prepilin peptidase)/N-methyltransferase